MIVALAAEFAVLGAAPGGGVAVALCAGLHNSNLEVGELLVFADGANRWPSTGQRIVNGKADCHQRRRLNHRIDVR